MNGDGKKVGRQNGQAGRNTPLKQLLARAIVTAVEGKSNSGSVQTRPKTKYDPPLPPAGQPSRHGSSNARPSVNHEGGIQMPQGNPVRKSAAQKQTVSRTQQKPRQAQSRPQQKQPGRQPTKQPAMRQGQQPVQMPPQRQPRRPLTPEERRRYEARRAQVLRMKRRRKHVRNFSALAVACLVFLILSLTVFFRIDNIIVESGKGLVYDESQIKSACGITYGSVNLFTCDVSEIENKLEKSLPYIGQATVTRSFPSSLKVTASPTVAAAAINCGTNYLLIDKEGKMLQLTQSQPKSIVVLRCSANFTITPGEYIAFADTSEGQTDKVLEFYKEIIAAMKKTKIPDITLIDIRDTQSIKLMYQNRLTLYLGTDTMLETKLSTAVKTLSVEDDGSKTKTGTIDLSTIGVAFVNDTEPTTESTTEATDLEMDNG